MSLKALLTSYNLILLAQEHHHSHHQQNIPCTLYICTCTMYIHYTEKYPEFQARFSLFSILFLTEQFRNGALSVTHQRMITITLRGTLHIYI